MKKTKEVRKNQIYKSHFKNSKEILNLMFFNWTNQINKQGRLMMNPVVKIKVKQ